jgi:predicted phage terminase large subunit-like protein
MLNNDFSVIAYDDDLDGTDDILDIKNYGDFLKQVAALGEDIRRTIELEVEAFASDPVASRERRERVQNDYAFFATTYFPHYVPTPHFSKFHDFVFERFPRVVDAEKDAREVYEAPRGEAKSTYVTQLGALWLIVTDRKHLLCIIMNTLEQSIEMLESIKVELDTNPRLMLDFPHATGQGRVWQASAAVTTNNIKIRVGGTGKKLRGMKHGPYRVDAVFLDDLENDENIKSKEQRDKTKNFVLSAVVGLAPPMGGMDIFWVGTSLHYNAAINQVGHAPGWRLYVFRAITRWPDNMALWDQWEAIYTRTGTNEERDAAEQEAKDFYAKHRAAMDAGAVVSWPGVRPLYKLMCLRATNHDSFSQEQQNEAGNDDNAPFKDITFWVNRLIEWVFFGAIDPSLGKKGSVSGDPSAILVGGLNRRTMILDVVEADIQRRVPDLIIIRAIDLQKEYACMAWAIEAVQFQAFFADQLIKYAVQAGIMFPAVPVIPNTDKDLRIMSLQPHIKNALLRLHRDQHTLISQLKYYPEADHDDGPDALDMLRTIATQFGGDYLYTPAGNTRSKTARYRVDDNGDWDDD